MGLVFTWPVGRATDGDRTEPPPLGPVAAYAVATTIGGALTGLVIGGASQVAREVLGVPTVAIAVVVAVLGGAVVAAEWRSTTARLPQRREQVPRRWLLWKHKAATAAAFGAMIGSGVLTPLKHPTTYGLAGVCALAPSLALAATIGAVYGAGRGSALVATWLGDRYVGKRPRWPRAGRPRAALRQALAITAMVAVGGAVWIAV
jgi:hypothetical protein